MSSTDGHLLTNTQDKAKSIIRSNKAEARAQSTNDGLIPKPKGRRSRDFNILEMMNEQREEPIPKETYNNLIVS
jgi:hypothetical protein